MARFDRRSKKWPQCVSTAAKIFSENNIEGARGTLIEKLASGMLVKIIV